MDLVKNTQLYFEELNGEADEDDGLDNNLGSNDVVLIPIKYEAAPN